MQKTLLDIQNLSIDFSTENENVTAIDDISFSINQGETLAVVGESGSGKSVSALSILSLLSKNAIVHKKSEILFLNKQNKTIDLLKINQKELENTRGNEIAMIFQEPMSSLNPLMRCGKQVSEMIQLHLKINKKSAKEKTLELFTEVKLPSVETTYNKYPHELSGGQKQRVMIAMAISCNPKLLIADEPTTALDVTVQKSIIELLQELQQKKGMSILFITHDLNLVKKFAHKIVVMFKGKIVESGFTKDIFENPQNVYTKGLIACRPDQKTRVKKLITIAEFTNDELVLKDKKNTISSIEFEKNIEFLNKQETVLELQNLHIWYPTQTNFFGKNTQYFKAVNGVNLQIKKGETRGLVGESGCGKTTIGKAIVKLCDISKGDILYKGKSIKSFSKEEMKTYRREVQIIFQDPYSSLNPRMTIGSAIKEPMDVYQIENNAHRKDKTIWLLEKVGLLASHFNRYPHEFSGGQRQRVSIARALALAPKCMICDESVSALDVSVQAQVLNLLVSLREEFSLTYLFISHDLNVIKHISDFVSVMKAGEIVEQNDANTIYHFPEKAYTKGLIESI